MASSDTNEQFIPVNEMTSLDETWKLRNRWSEKFHKENDENRKIQIGKYIKKLGARLAKLQRERDKIENKRLKKEKILLDKCKKINIKIDKLNQKKTSIQEELSTICRHFNLHNYQSSNWDRQARCVNCNKWIVLNRYDYSCNYN